MSQENVEIVRESLSAFTGGGLAQDVHTIRDGKIVCGREYIDRNQALEALRLRE